MLLYVHRNYKAYQGRGAQDGHLDFHTAPELCRVHVGLSSEGFSLGARVCVCVCVGYSLMISGWLVYSACSIGEGR